MKAVYFLFCLTLAYHCTANIVRHQLQPQFDQFFIQPLGLLGTPQWPQQSESTSASTSESQESKEMMRDEGDDVSNRSVNKHWYTPLISPFIKQVEKVPYGDVIDWQGIQYAAGPKSPVKNAQDIENIFKDAYKTMEPLTEEEKRMIHAAFGPDGVAQSESVRANATQLLKKNKYGVEEHVVKTDDGYFLTLFRIQPKEHISSKVATKRPVVLLMHGILGSADDWLLLGPKASLAYMLADLGCDVWLGNTRGNKYSRRHSSKHVSNPDFWQFSVDEIATNDLPAIIDYTLQASEQKKLFYVGHSQGSTVFFALMAALPQYKEKVSMMFALSPMVYMTNVRSPFFKMISPTSSFYESLHEQLGNGEFKIGKDLMKVVGGNICQKKIGCRHVCSNLNFVVTGADVTSIEFAMLPSIVSHLPAGSSTRVIKQIGQAVASREFRKYDYGSTINNMIYDQSEPPKYDMTKVDVPVALYYSEEDWLAHPKDVERLQKELPNVVDHYMVPEKHFTHMDFQFSRNAPEVIYKRLIESVVTETVLSRTN
ncbi:unnamed protein product [Euphydryas editha]|uniref:AB hydrolase-1 domain-containing protein n=1 Tax=Euphydryas editha TaxID=104508 RepID=A0AAU9TWL8_EUPED|nr:unnamed protein product [Euphydryas editha]